MVKMSVGQAMSQKSSLQALIAHQVGSYSQLEQALNQFISSTPNLKGVTYESAKSYASQVLLPLVRGSILLSEAVGSSTDAYVSGYLSQCGGTDLDSEDLERQIAQCDRQLKQLNLYLSDLSDDDRPNPSALSSLTNQINLIGKTRQRLYDQLRKLHAFNASSTTYFSDLAALRSAVQQGLSQAQLWWQSGSQTFVQPHGQDMLWAGFLNAKWGDVQALAIIEKVEAGKDLSRTELNELTGYLVDNPESRLHDRGMSAFYLSLDTPEQELAREYALEFGKPVLEFLWSSLQTKYADEPLADYLQDMSVKALLATNMLITPQIIDRVTQKLATKGLTAAVSLNLSIAPDLVKEVGTNVIGNVTGAAINTVSTIDDNLLKVASSLSNTGTGSLVGVSMKQGIKQVVGSSLKAAPFGAAIDFGVQIATGEEWKDAAIKAGAHAFIGIGVAVAGFVGWPAILIGVSGGMAFDAIYDNRESITDSLSELGDEIGEGIASLGVELGSLFT